MPTEDLVPWEVEIVKSAEHTNAVSAINKQGSKGNTSWLSAKAYTPPPLYT